MKTITELCKECANCKIGKLPMKLRWKCRTCEIGEKIVASVRDGTFFAWMDEENEEAVEE